MGRGSQLLQHSLRNWHMYLAEITCGVVAFIRPHMPNRRLRASIARIQQYCSPALLAFTLIAF